MMTKIQVLKKNLFQSSFFKLKKGLTFFCLFSLFNFALAIPADSNKEPVSLPTSVGQIYIQEETVIYKSEDAIISGEIVEIVSDLPNLSRVTKEKKEVKPVFKKKTEEKKVVKEQKREQFSPKIIPSTSSDTFFLTGGSAKSFVIPASNSIQKFINNNPDYTVGRPNALKI